MKKSMNSEIKKVVERMKKAQTRFQGFLKEQSWVEEAKKYAEVQGKEVRKLLESDIGKVKTFIEKERKELERFQRQIPGEVKKFRQFAESQRKELEKLLVNVRKAKKAAGKAKRKTGTTKKRSASTSTKKATSSS